MLESSYVRLAEYKVGQAYIVCKVNIHKHKCGYVLVTFLAVFTRDIRFTPTYQSFYACATVDSDSLCRR